MGGYAAAIRVSSDYSERCSPDGRLGFRPSDPIRVPLLCYGVRVTRGEYRFSSRQVDDFNGTGVGMTRLCSDRDAWRSGTWRLPDSWFDLVAKSVFLGKSWQEHVSGVSSANRKATNLTCGPPSRASRCTAQPLIYAPSSPSIFRVSIVVKPFPPTEKRNP